MDLIDKYIYAVISRIPQKRREETEKEIRSMIDDMMDAYGGASAENAQRAIEELGDPRKLADQYNDAKKYVISPRIYDSYAFVLKITLYAVLIGIVAVSIIEGATGKYANVGEGIGSFISGLIMGGISTFGFVTLGFMIVDRYNVKMELQKPWTVADLKDIPVESARIKRADCIVGIVFSTAFMILFATLPWIFSAYIPVDGSLEIINVFNIDVIGQRIWLVFAIYAVGVLREIMKLIAGRWSFMLGVFLAVAGVVSLMFCFGLFGDMAIWNPSFAQDVTAAANIEGDIFISVWSAITNLFIWILVIGSIVGIVSDIVKGFKNR